MNIPDHLTIADLALQKQIQILTPANACDGMTISDARLDFQGEIALLKLIDGRWIKRNKYGSSSVVFEDDNLIHVEGLHRLMPYDS
jgi:hypothetical protein